MPRRTKIIATIGPASIQQDTFNKMVGEGLDFVRINMAYATGEQVAQIQHNILQIGKIIPIIYDIRDVEKANILNQLGTILHIALSFCEEGSQIEKLKTMFPKAKVIAKIETQKGIDNYKEIFAPSWGVMVARGDLGEAIKLEKVPCIQKRFTKMLKDNEKFLIVATEMLLSMLKSQTPTRAEVSDVANAVFEGADAVMLSEETALGDNPVLAVSYMRKIIEEAENCDFD